MDEPFRTLDAQTGLLRQEERLCTWKENQKMVIYAPHTIEEALLLADRVLALIINGQPGLIREGIRTLYGRLAGLIWCVNLEIEDLNW